MAITNEQIEAWKAEHGKIYKIDAGDDLVIIYKALSRSDYVEIMSGQVAGLFEDPEIETVKRCVVNDIPDSLYEDKGGLATVVYEEIMKKSGFVLVESEEL